MQEIATLIGTVGFPIAAYLLMFWDKRESIGKLTDVVSSNTSVMHSLSAEIVRLKDAIDRDTEKEE